MKGQESTLSAMIGLLAAGVIGSIVYLAVNTREQSVAEKKSLNELAKSDLIRVISPLPNQKIASPLVIEGLARGPWFFEADFPVTLLDSSGNVLGRCIARTQSDWMTEEFVPFRAELEFAADAAAKGVLAFHRNNPSGLAKHDDRLTIPVVIRRTETINIKVFFNNSRLDPEVSCDKVFAVERWIPRTRAVARAALEQLLKGPSEKEKADGYFTNINPGVRIRMLTIENAIAGVHFDEQLQFRVGGACRVSAIRAQITQTLRQFPAVERVIISINGRTDDILQP
jgi:hypothetical protein